MIIGPLGSEKDVRRYDRSTPRNPETGIIVGAEPRDLGPEDASCAILFVHGFSGTGNNYHDLPDRVADTGWRTRVMLLPGHGTSPFTFETTTADELLSAVIQELRAMRDRYEKLVLVGHSMGGALATLAASQMPLDGLILAAPYYNVTFKWYYVLTAEQWAKMLSPLIRWIHAPAENQPVNRREVRTQILSYPWIPTRAFLTAMSLAERARQLETLHRIYCPTLLIHSTKDNVTSPETAAKAFAEIPSANKRAIWIEHSDHIIFWDYDREQVAEETLAFLKQVGSTAS
ncbi:MAG TPA: alpha/beta fold hydrolase [Candidatus Hydrogenedentes bacterium]|nr:alpha/beta fold hydrolase [Candidatus Hydrogenedentota bacterium]